MKTDLGQLGHDLQSDYRGARLASLLSFRLLLWVLSVPSELISVFELEPLLWPVSRSL